MTADEELRRALDEYEPSGTHRDAFADGWTTALAARSEPLALGTAVHERAEEQWPSRSEPRAEGLRERVAALLSSSMSDGWNYAINAALEVIDGARWDDVLDAATPPADGRPGREQEAYDAGRLAGYEEGLDATPPAGGLRERIEALRGTDRSWQRDAALDDVLALLVATPPAEGLDVEDIYRVFSATIPTTGTLGRSRTRRNAIGTSEARQHLRRVIDEARAALAPEQPE